MTVRYPRVEDVLPQGGRMVLLSGIVDHTETRTVCTTEASPASVFADADGGVPAWVALEYMAQCIAAHGGLCARARGEPVRIGFLLGSRSVVLRVARFHPSQRLEVEAAHVWGEHDFFSFACTVRDACTRATLCEGTLTVARAPADAPAPLTVGLTGRGPAET